MTGHPTNPLWHSTVMAIRLFLFGPNSVTQDKNVKSNMISEASFENAKTSSVVLLPWWISQWEKEDCLLKTEEKLRGLSWLCNHTDAKWSAVWRGHLRPEHLDNELRCNPKLRWTAVYPPRSPSLVLYRQCRFSLFTSPTLPLSLIPGLIFYREHILLPCVIHLIFLIYFTPLISSFSLSPDALFLLGTVESNPPCDSYNHVLNN